MAKQKKYSDGGPGVAIAMPVVEAVGSDVAITSKEAILERLKGYDYEYHYMLYNQRRYAFGAALTNKIPNRESGVDFPYFEDEKVRALAIGQSRDILNDAVQSVSRHLSGDPEPNSPQVDKWTGELRKQTWLTRYEEGGWHVDREDVFMDGDNLGYGAGEIIFKRDIDTGMPFTTVRHCASCNVIYDRHNRSIEKARWIAFVYYCAPEDVYAMYPSLEGQEGFVKKYYEGSSREHKCIRITVYYDLGHGVGQPTRAVIVGPWDGEKAFQERKASPFRRYLPVFWYEYISVSGLARPIGKILLNEATQAARNDLQKMLRNIVKKGTGVDLVDMKQCDEADVKRWLSGEPVTHIKMIEGTSDPNGRPPIIRIQSMEVANAFMALWGIYENQRNADSSKAETDPGGNSAGKLASTIVLNDQRAQSGQSLTKLQINRMDRRLFDRTGKCMALGDRNPLMVDYFGFNVQLNSPMTPELMLDKVFEEASRVVMDAQAMEAMDVTAKQTQQLNMINVMAEDVAAGRVNPMKYTEAKLKALNFDPNEWMMTPGEAGGAGAMPSPGQLVADPNAIAADAQTAQLPSGQMQNVARQGAAATV